VEADDLSTSALVLLEKSRQKRHAALKAVLWLATLETVWVARVHGAADMLTRTLPQGFEVDNLFGEPLLACPAWRNQQHQHEYSFGVRHAGSTVGAVGGMLSTGPWDAAPRSSAAGPSSTVAALDEHRDITRRRAAIWAIIDALGAQAE
jgi:hypothetical protein